MRADYINDIVQSGKEPAFLLTLAFLLTFGVVRFITYSIHEQTHTVFPNVTTKGGLHIHHMVPGLVPTLATGYLGLILPAPRPTHSAWPSSSAWASPWCWMSLRSSCGWPMSTGSQQGGIDAVVLAGGIAILYLIGPDFWWHLIETLLRADSA